jgi:hypothetical protein
MLRISIPIEWCSNTSPMRTCLERLHDRQRL